MDLMKDMKLDDNTRFPQIQLRYSKSIEMHALRLKERYGFTNYTDPNAPTLFYGMFFSSDWKTALEHTGKRAVLWSGSDALGIGRVKALCGQPDILHIVSSKWVESDIKKHTGNYIVVPRINSPLEDWAPCPLGEKIYWCNSDEDKYGRIYRTQLIEEFGFDAFIFTNSHGDYSNTSVTKEEMARNYARCFIGLRLTERDGCPQTVMELGLMGRPVIWNGDSPNALYYNNVNQIIDLIKWWKNLWKNKSQSEKTAKLMRSYLSTDLHEVLEAYFKIK